MALNPPPRTFSCCSCFSREAVCSSALARRVDRSRDASAASCAASAERLRSSSNDCAHGQGGHGYSEAFARIPLCLGVINPGSLSWGSRCTLRCRPAPYPHTSTARAWLAISSMPRHAASAARADASDSVTARSRCSSAWACVGQLHAWSC